MKLGFYIIRESDGEMLESSREHYDIGMLESESLAEVEEWLNKNASSIIRAGEVTEWEGVYHAEFYQA